MKVQQIKSRLLILLTSLVISNVSFAAAPVANSPSINTVTKGLAETTIDGTSKAALIGAGVGQLTNAAANQYMSNQENELRTQTAPNLSLEGVSVIRDGNRIHLILPAQASFTKDSTDTNADLIRILDTIATIERKYNSTFINVTGNADASESNQNNLGLRRANNVAAYLQHQGIPYERLQSNSKGARNPLGSNDNTKGRTLNRRIDITLIPLTK